MSDMLFFNEAILNSVPEKGHLILYKGEKYYFENEYAEPIKKYFDSLDVDSNEVIPNKKNGLVSMCALASSARFAFLDFYPKNVQFEKKIYNDVSRIPTKMDAVKNADFYECKCQELVKGERETLTSSYLGTRLFSEFNIENISLVTKIVKRDGKDIEQKCLKFNMSDMGVAINETYDKIHFNVKQLICHLIAIANSYPDGEKNLRYVIYTPSEKVINQSKRLIELYEDIRKEIDEIWKSENIRSFLKKHSIQLPMPVFKPVDTIDDFVYKQVYKDSNPVFNS